MELIITIISLIFGLILGYLAGLYSVVSKKKAIVLVYDNEEDFLNLLSKINNNQKL